MSVRSIVTDHSGRSVDLAITTVEDAVTFRATQLSLTAGEDGGRALAGPLVYTQAVMSCFLTAIGSDPVYADYGTSFIPACRKGLLRTDSDVTVYFSLAVNEMMNFFYTRGLFEDTPPDETVNNITLEQYELDTSNAKLVLYVKVHFKEGDAIDIITPIKVI